MAKKRTPKLKALKRHMRKLRIKIEMNRRRAVSPSDQK